MTECATCVGCRPGDDLQLHCPDCGRKIHHEDWCFGHQRPEAWFVDGELPYTCCGECFHVFRTPEDLLALHNEILVSLNRAPETDVDKIYCCPVCVHDF